LGHGIKHSPSIRIESWVVINTASGGYDSECEDEMLDIVKHAGIVAEKRNSDFYFVGSIKNGFVPSTRQKVFDAIKSKKW
jgi:hypothetical protein